MDERSEAVSAVPAEGSSVAYEPPRLTPIGNLHDLLAGIGSNPCDAGEIATGPDPISGPPGAPDQCGPV
jgi:hypothetical protein